MRDHARAIAATSMVLFVLLVGAVPASAADPSWNTPVGFGRTGRESAPPDLAVAPNGEAILAWEGGSPNAVRVSTKPPGGTWSAPVILAKAREVGGPHIAVSARKAVVVWSDNVHTRSGETAAVMASTRLRGKGWGKPQRLSASKRFREEPEGSEPQVAISRGGKVVAIWQAGDEAHSTTYYIGSATQSAAGTRWSAPVGIRGSYAGEQPELAVAPDGEATATWSATYDEESAIEVASRPPGGPWGGAVRLGRPGAYASPRLVLTTSGEAIAAWSEEGEDEESGSQLQVATRKPGGRWKSRPIGPKDGPSSISLLAEPGGGVRLIWDREGPAGEEVVSATRSQGGGWKKPTSLVSEGLELPQGVVPKLAVGAAGESVAVWHEVQVSGEGSFHAASRPPSGPWGPPEPISAPSLPGPAGEPDLQVVFGRSGEAFAVWRRHAEGGWVVEVATRSPG